jgi:predicted acetyltransferase
MLYKAYDPNEETTKTNQIKFWEGDELEKKVKEEEDEFKKKMTLSYPDNYIQEHKNNMAFQAVANFLSVNLDYLDKGINKLENLESLRERMKSDYDISMLTPLDQRLWNVSIQHPITQ